jgi:hypothetical protein
MGELEDLHAEIEILKTEVRDMREEMYAMNAARALEIAETRQMIASFRSTIPKAKKPSTDERIAQVDKLLFACYPSSRTFDELGKLLELGPNHKQIMTSFSHHLLPFADDRYLFCDSPCRRGTGKTIRLTPPYHAHLKRQYSKKDSIPWD